MMVPVLHACDALIDVSGLEPRALAGVRAPNLPDPDTPMADPHADAHSEYVHGTQSVDEQAATYSLVMNLFKWGSLAVGAILLLLVLWFQPGGSLLTGLIAAVVFSAAGWWFLRSKPVKH